MYVYTKAKAILLDCDHPLHSEFLTAVLYQRRCGHRVHKDRRCFSSTPILMDECIHITVDMAHEQEAFISSICSIFCITQSHKNTLSSKLYVLKFCIISSQLLIEV